MEMVHDRCSTLLTEFGTALTIVLPILFQYCYKYCYSDSSAILLLPLFRYTLFPRFHFYINFFSEYCITNYDIRVFAQLNNMLTKLREVLLRVSKFI